MSIVPYFITALLIRLMVEHLFDGFSYILQLNNFRIPQHDWKLSMIKNVLSVMLLIPFAAFMIATSPA